MNSERLYSTIEAATEAGVSEGRLRQLAPVLGIGRKVGRSWVFTDADLAILKSRDRRPGRRWPAKPELSRNP